LCGEGEGELVRYPAWKEKWRKKEKKLRFGAVMGLFGVVPDL